MDKVFINRTLNLKKINYIGFDLDHTLVRYQSKKFESLNYDLIRDYLLSKKKYPAHIKKFKFQFNSVIRGLIIDKKRGNLLKLNRYGAIRVCRYGKELLTPKQVEKIYKNFYIDLFHSDYLTIDSFFSISFSALFLQLVELKKTLKKSLPLTYKEMANDILEATDYVHSSGKIKNIVMKNINQYLKKDPSIVRGLENFKKNNKKLFIITNSGSKFATCLLDYAIQPYLKEHSHWSELFTFVITSANKPDFFTRNTPFIPLSHKNKNKLLPGIYKNGCADLLTKALKTNYSEILYVGDHIYGDNVLLKKKCGWRTALIIEELEDHIQKLKKTKSLEKKIETIMKRKIPLEKKVDDLFSKNLNKKNKDNYKKISQFLERISQLDSELSKLIIKKEKTFNPYWGDVMRTGNEESYFANQVERFACFYCSSIKDFVTKNPRAYYRSGKRPFPHEL